LYSVKRTPVSFVYIIVAADYEKALESLEKLGAMNHGFEGIYTGP